MKKVSVLSEDNGYEVAVLTSPDYGCGWYTWHRCEELIFAPNIVEKVLRCESITIEDIAEALEITVDEAEERGLDLYTRSLLRVHWVKENDGFIIDEYDGAESLVLEKDMRFIYA